jgi:hypothetical protein
MPKGPPGYTAFGSAYGKGRIGAKKFFHETQPIFAHRVVFDTLHNYLV